jgi:hypothetical protein
MYPGPDPDRTWADPVMAAHLAQARAGGGFKPACHSGPAGQRHAQAKAVRGTPGRRIKSGSTAGGRLLPQVTGNRGKP